MLFVAYWLLLCVLPLFVVVVRWLLLTGCRWLLLVVVVCCCVLSVDVYRNLLLLLVVAC